MAEGVAKRATISIGFHVDQSAIDKFEHSLKDIDRDNTNLREAFDRTDSSLDRFYQHIEQLTGRNNEAMDRLRRADNQAAEASRHLGTGAERTAAIHNRASQRIIDGSNHVRDNARQSAEAQVNSNRRITGSTANMTREQYQAAAHQREAYRQEADAAKDAQERVGGSLHEQTREQYQAAHSMGQYSREMQHGSEMSNRVSSANGRIASSFGNSSRAIDRHAQAIRDAQGRDYRWLRTAQDMSGATLGLGAAFYKGAKDATSLQQAYMHAGNMAHYGGERLSSVQKDINQQYQVGTALSTKYGVSQNQIAQGYQTLIARGYSTTEALHAQKSMLQASIASGDNYNDVVNNSSNIIDAFGLRTNNAAKMATNAKTAVNQMAYAADQTASNFKDLGYGMAYVGATAHTAHQSISETSSALGILSNKGMQASMAGTGLRKVLNSFLSINKKGQQAQVMQQLGLTEQDFKTPEGNLKSLSSLMSILNDKTKNMDSQERASVFHRFFGSTGQEAALNLASDTKGLSHLNDQVERSQNMGNGKGYVALLSGRNMRSAQNQLHVFEQAWQAFTITSAREILPTLTGILKHVDVLIGDMNKLSPAAKKWTVFGALAVAAISPISYAIFGVQSAFHGVEMTLLHVRKLFSRPVSNTMSKSALANSGEQEKAALKRNEDNSLLNDETTGTSPYMNKLSQDAVEHPWLTKMRLGRQRLGGRLTAGAKGLLTPLTMLGGNYGIKSGATPWQIMHARPSMLARLNPFNKSARFFTGRFNPFMTRLPRVTGNPANAMLRGTGKSILGRLISSPLSKGLGSALAAVPDAYNAFKAKNRTSKFSDWGKAAGTAVGTGVGTYFGGPIGGMLGGSIGHFAGGIVGRLLHSFSQTKLGHQLGHVFAPIGKAITNGLRGPIKSIAHSWNYIKRGFMSGIKPITQEWHRLFSGQTKQSRQTLRTVSHAFHAALHVLQGTLHIAGTLLAGTFRLIAKLLGNVLKYGGKFIAWLMKAGAWAVRVSGHIIHAFADIGHAVLHPIQSVKSLGSAIGVMGADGIRDIGRLGSHIRFDMGSAADWIKSKWNGMTSWFSGVGHRIASGISDGWHDMESAASGAVSSIKSTFVSGFETMKNDVEGILNDVKGAISDVANAVSHPIKTAESAMHSHAAGGAIPQNEMSLVNEKGRESAYNPTTNKFRLFPNNGPQVIPLYAGEHVLTAQDTRELLTTGMGRGVTLPGYANGTDTLNNVRNSRKAKQFHSYAIGTGRAGAISGEESSESPTQQAADSNLFRTGVSWTPASVLNIPNDVASNIHHPLSAIGSALGDLPDSSMLKGTKLASPLKALKNSSVAKHLSAPADDLLSSLEDKIPIHHLGTKLGHLLDPDALNRNFKKIKPMAHNILDFGKKFGENMLHSPVVHGLRNFMSHPLRTMKQGWNRLRNMGRNIGKGISNFGRGLGKTASKAWNGLKRNTGRAWRGLKRNAGHMLKGAQRMGRGAMRGMRRFGRNVGRGIRRFGRNTMRAGRRIARNVGRDIHRFGRGLARTGRRMFRNASRGIRRFGRNVMRQGRRIYRGGRRLVGRAARGLRRFGRNAINGAKRIGRRIWSSAKGTAKRVWNAAKSTGKNVWSNAKKVGSDVSSAARSLWSKTKSGAEATWSTVKSGASAAWSRIRSGASEMASAVRSKVSDLVSAAKSKAESAWSTIKSGASAAASAAKSVIGSIVSFAASVVSRVKSMISSIHMPHLASGGPIRDTTMALVGEHGVETAYNRSTGSIRFLGVHGPQITTLLAGERVLTNTQTERLLHGGLGRGIKLPAFAKGTGNTAAELDNSNSHSAPSSSTMSITGSFSGVSALKEMLSFGKKSKSIWGDISDNVVKAVTDARTESGTQWTGLSKDVGDINDKMSKATSTSFQDMGQKVNKLVSDLSEGLVEAAKDTASGFGDKFGDLITYAKSDVKKVIAAINRGISGIDTALRSFGGNSHVIHQIHYATGTMNGRIAYPQLGILNDATTGPKQEAIVRGNQIMLPQGDNVRIPLQRGDAVLNGDQTKELINHTTNINHYASGSGIHLSSRMIKGMTNILKTATKSPATAFRRYVGNDIKPSGHPFTQGIESMIAKPVAKLGVPWTKAMFSYIQSLLTPPDDGSGANLNASDSNGSELLAEAEKLGAAAHNRYVWGANGPSAYDCGGLVLAALHHFGYTSDDRQTIIDHFPRESRADALPGDLVENGEHEGIVADKGAHHYYSAFNPAEGIKMYPLDQTHWTADDPTMRFARIDMAPRTSTAPKAKKNKESALQRLVASELGSSATSWLKKAAELFAGGGDADFNTMHIPGGEGGWTKRGSQAWNMARDVFYAAKSLGLDAKHAAAVVGNAWHESAGFQYGLMVNQFGGGGGKGLFQFTGQPSKDGWTPLGQTKSILENATPGQESSWKHEDESTYKLAEDFETIFERGSIPAYAARAQAADTAYDMFAANGGWADKNHQRIFGEAGPEVAINPARDSADHLIIQAIGARMRNSPNSPIAGLVKSLGIKDKAHSLITGIKGLLTGSTPKPRRSNNPIKINVTNNITIQGNPGTNQAHQITRNVEKAIQRGIQRAALRTRNRLDW